jgi:uncharacterized membrane protein
MKVRSLVLVGGAIVVGMLALSVWAWPQIPADAQIPIHWGPSGEVDGYGPKWLGLLGLPVVALGVVALLAFIPRIEPRRENLARSAPAYIAICLVAIAFVAAIHAVAVMAALGGDVDVAAVALIGAGVMFAVIGNFLGKTRSNWFFGVRTPWTLSSELSWSRTHRLGGRIFLGLGVLVLVATVVVGSAIALWVMLASLALGVVILVAYSYFVWRDDPDRERMETAR